MIIHVVYIYKRQLWKIYIYMYIFNYKEFCDKFLSNIII